MQINELKINDIVTYSFVTRDGGLCEAVVEILELKTQQHDNIPIAKVRLIKSVSDNTGNNLFTYLAKTGGSMWASCMYLHPKNKEIIYGEN